MRSRRPLSRIGRYLLAVAIVGSAMALGSIHTSVLCVVALFVGAAAVLVWWGAERVLVRPAATAILLTGLGLTFYTLLQAMPLPASFVGVIAPHTADIWARCLSPLHEPGPSWVSISLDPIATRIEVLRGVVYVAAFLAALKITSRRDGSGFLATAIIAGGVIMAIAAIVHPALGITSVYGFYKPGPGIDPRHVAPLLNPNHLAAYLNIAFSVALAAAIAREPAVPRAFAIAAVLLLVGTQLWVASRGGVLMMVVAGPLIVWMSRKRAADARATLARAVPLLVVAVVSLGMIVFGASREAVIELASSDASKLGAVREMSRMIPTYWIFGAGRGAFESTFPEFRDGTTHAVFTHPETLLVQWPAEWGVPVAIAAAAALLIALWPRASVARSHASVGAWVALATAGAHNLIDFSSEMPGVVIALCVCAAIVVGGAPDHAPRTRLGRWSLRPRAPAIGMAVMTSIALIVGASCIGRELVADREALRVLALEPMTSLTSIHSTARAAMQRHPSEPYLPFAVALRAGRLRDESVIPWIERVLERAHVYGPAHLVLARFLVRASPAQARMEYRISLEQEPDLLGVVVKEAPRLVGGIDDAMELVPKAPGDARFIELLIDELAERAPATAFGLNRILLERVPKSARGITRAAVEAVADLEGAGGLSWCIEEVERAACRDRAISFAVALQHVSPERCVGYELEARARVAAGEGPSGLVVLRDAAGRVEDRASCQRSLVALAVKTGDAMLLTAALEDLVHAGCGEDSECVTNLIFAAEIESSRGNPARALALYKRARERDPQNDNLLAAISALASRLSMHAEAMQGYASLARRHPENPAWAAAAAAEKQAIVAASPRF